VYPLISYDTVSRKISLLHDFPSKEEEKDCKAVITQLSAVRSAVDRTVGVIVSTNLLECVQNAEGDGEKMNEAIQEAVNLVVKSR